MKKKTLISIIAVALVLCVSVGGVLAWLTDKTDPVVNTFTVGNIDLTLAETTTNYKMVPGATIDKDPVVTVKANSEKCWVFVKFEKSANLDDFITYTAATGWSRLEGVDDEVYYRVQDATTEDVTYSVLANDKVAVKDTVTKGMMDELKADGAVQPKLTFTAYAIQYAGFDTAAGAWAEVSKTN